MKLSMDSGAHSIFTMLRKDSLRAVGKRGNTMVMDATTKDLSLNSKEVREYVDAYIEWIHGIKDYLEMYVTVDLIRHPQESWRIQRYMEESGLTPVPVFHHGEDFRWLRKCIDSYPYIGVTGIGTLMNRQRYLRYGDKMFSTICTSKGTPRVKVHGFSLTSPAVLSRYPFYSADSSTWGAQSRNGSVMLPRFDGRDYDWFSPKTFRFTERTVKDKKHFCQLVPSLQDGIREYLETVVGITDVEDLQDPRPRDVANIVFMLRMQKALKELYTEKWGYGEGGNILLAGNSAEGIKSVTHIIRLLRGVGYVEDLSQVHFFGSPYEGGFRPRRASFLIEARKRYA